MTDLLVLGTRGVGKTTLLAVLGYKFEKQGAFGLSLVPCDRETMLHVRAISRNMVQNHRFPAATDKAEFQAVSWNVVAGTTTQFRLSSLDCGGELVSMVFGGGGESDPFPESPEGQSLNQAAAELSALAERAKAVCLVLAPDDLPENRSVRSLSDPVESRRFEEIDDLLHAIAHSPKFRGKKIVVALTRTDAPEIRDEIARCGGPAGYCRAKCPVFAPSKRLSAAHVVAVAPVVSAGTGEVPDNFASSGLEELLIAFGGAVLDPTAPISHLARAQQTLHAAEWSDNLAQLSGTAAERLAAARRFAAATESLRTATESFLDAVSADTLTKSVTRMRLAETEASARHRKAVEEAIAQALTRWWAPRRDDRFCQSVLDAAKAAANAAPGISPAASNAFFLPSPWILEQRRELPRARAAAETALRAAIQARDRIAADKAFDAFRWSSPNPDARVFRKFFAQLNRLPYPDLIRPLHCRLLRRSSSQFGIFFGERGRLACRNHRLEYIPIYRHAPAWSCDIGDIRETTFRADWLACILEVVAGNGEKKVFGTWTLASRTEMESFRAALEGLRQEDN